MGSTENNELPDVIPLLNGVLIKLLKVGDLARAKIIVEAIEKLRDLGEIKS